MLMLKPIALSVVCVFSVAGCAIPARQQADRPAVQPVLALQHGGAFTSEANRLGRALEAQARYEQAVAAYREALKLNPLSVDAYTGLGMALAAQHRYEEAIRQFQAAVVLAPDAAYLHNNLGYAYLLIGSNEHAMKELEEAVRLDARHERFRANLRLAQARLASRAAQPAPESAPAALQPVMEPVTGTKLVEVSPQVFELRTPTRARASDTIDAVPLAPLPQNGSGSTPMRSFNLEISNGNGVLGLAKRVAGRLVVAGLQTARLTNQRPFDQPRTEVQYREGYATEAALLASRLQHPIQLKPSNELARHVDVRLVLGKDALNDTALIMPIAPTRPAATTVAAR